MNARAETAVAEAAQAASIDLARLDLTDVALAQFGPWRDQVATATQHFSTLVVEMPTQAKVDEFKSMRQRMINTPLATARATSKAVKSKLNTTSKDVGTELEAIETAWAGVDKLITPQIDARQAELDADRARKAAGEAFRKALHLALIERIKGYVEQAKGLPSERISKGVTLVEGMTFGGECEDFLPKYQAARDSALADLRVLLDSAKNAEAIEAQRLENERVAAELAAKQKALDDQAAALKLQQDEALAARVAQTHAIVFAFPESEPEPVPAVAQAVQARPEPTGDAQASQPAAQEQAVQVEQQTVTESRVAGNGVRFVRRVPAPEPEAQPGPNLINTADLCALIGLDLSTQRIRDFGLESRPTPEGKRGTFWDAGEADRLTDALVKHLLERKAQRAVA